MTTEDWQRISAIFHAALARPQTERLAYLEQVCEGDDQLLARVERLLEAERNAGPFGEQPLVSREQMARQLAQPTGNAPGFEPASPDGEAAGAATGRRWPFLGALLVAATATAAVFAYAAWLLLAGGGSMPSLGWEAVPRGQQWVVIRVAADGPAADALRDGDELLLMNGTPPGPDPALLLHRRDLAVGDAYTLTISRGGERLTLSLDVDRGSNATALVYFLVSLVWCAVGLFIGFARPQAVLARLACFTSLAVGLVFVQISVIQSGLLWQPLHGVLGFHFLARFPSGEPTRGRWRIALVIAYLLGGAAAVLGLTSHGLALLLGTAPAIDRINAAAGWFGLRTPLALIAFAVAVVGMVAALIHNWRRLRDEDQRRRIRWVLYGALVGLVPQLWWTSVTLIEAFAGPTSIPRLDLVDNAFTVAIPLTMAYAVVKHRVLDIRIVVRRGLKYLLAKRALQAIVALPFVVLVYILVRNRDLTLNELATETVGYAVWLLLAALALRFRAAIALWLDQRFFREEFDREQLMMRLLDESRRVESLSELSQLVSMTLAGAVHPSSAYVWYRDPRERLDTAATIPEISAEDFPAAEPFLHWLEQQGSVVYLPMLAQAGVAAETLAWFALRGIAVIVPMADSADRLIGALFLGGKKSEEPYDIRDSKLLDAVAKQTAFIRENLRLRARLSEEVRMRHDVLSRLDDQLPALLKECPDCGRCYDGSVERCLADEALLVFTLPVGRTVDDRYRLDRLLGKGGMGAVYEARDLRLERSVAIKILLARGLRRAGTLRRFRREARATARLSHPNIVTIYDFGSLEEEMAYIVMERVHGETLRLRLEREGRLRSAALREWFEPMLSGIAAAHANGIVHRDLKPENVMGARNSAGALDVKILDLGLAKLRAQEQQEPETMTQEGLVMGTPDYMSPEQLLGREVDQRSDLFAVGVMLLEALTGRRIRRGDLRSRKLLEIDLSAYELAPAWLELVGRCLAPDPEDRPPSAEALSATLLRCCS